MYSTMGGDWKYYTEGGDRKVFTGNYDRNTAVQQVFKDPIQARYVRFVVEGFSGYPVMRVELFGVGTDNGGGITGAPLGLSTGSIKDDAFTASSAHGNNWSYYGPQFSRLNSQQNFGGWIPNFNRPGEWIQVDLGKVTDVGGIATQGRAHGSYWVKTYTLLYSKDGETWVPYGRNAGETDTIIGNDDYFTVVKHELKDFKARYVRLQVESFENGWPTLRWELYSPEAPQHRLGGPLGISDFRVADSALTASSAHGNNWDYYGPRHARLYGGGPWGGWIPNVNAAGEWVQADLGRVYEVAGVATQGRRWGSYWVRSYVLAYSQDGKEWAFYSMDGEQTVFDGNDNYNTVNRHVLQAPFLARYVRIIVRSFANGWPTLRFELYGPHDSRKGDLATIGVPFGLANGVVLDDQISSSSFYRTTDKACVPQNGRLNSDAGAGAWIAGSDAVGEYFQIETKDSNRPIGGVAIQGRAFKSKLYSGNRQWVTAFTLQHSSDGKNFVDYKEAGVVRYFAGSQDSDTVVKHAIKRPFTAAFVRILPTSWYGSIAMRAELYDTADFQLKKAEEEKQAKLKAIEEEKAKEKAAKERAEREEYQRQQAVIKARAQEKAALEERRAAEVAEATAKTDAARKAAEEAEAEADKAVAKYKDLEAKLEAAKVVNAAKIKAANEVAEAKMKVLNAKLEEHRANNLRLESARNKLRALGKTLSDMKLARQDMLSSQKAGSADHAAERRRNRELTKKVADAILELYKLRDSYLTQVRNREQNIRKSEEKAYLTYLERNNPYRRTNPTNWPVLPGGKPRKICTCKDAPVDPKNIKGRKLGSKTKLDKDAPIYDDYKGDRS
jgi:hypothetical protein